MRKFPLRAILTSIIAIALIVVAVIFLRKLAINKKFVQDYNAGVFNLEEESKLLKMNIFESYKPYYNLGNVYYKKGDYNSAIANYEDALKNKPTEEDECLIRINLALAMCNTIDFQKLDSEEKIQTALFVLYKARDVLTEKGCASAEGHDGHNADAQQLKEDIDKMIEKLENPEDQQQQQDQQDQQDQQQQQQQEEEQQDQQDDGTSNNDKKEKEKQKELEKQRQKSQEERQKEQQEQENQNGGKKPGQEDPSGGGDQGQNGGEGGDEEGGEGGGGESVNPW